MLNHTEFVACKPNVNETTGLGIKWIKEKYVINTYFVKFTVYLTKLQQLRVIIELESV